MAISGIGTSCTYIYNSQTGKLSKMEQKTPLWNILMATGRTKQEAS